MSRKLSEQHKKNISKGLKKAYSKDRVGYWKGKSRKGIITEEGKKSISDARKGKKLSKEHKKKLSDSHKGNAGYWTGKKGPKRTSDTRRKMSEAHKKHPERHWAWKGGVTEGNNKIRHSLDNRLWREAVFKRDDYTCQKCCKRGEKIVSHHILNFAEHPELRFEISNGVTLCKECHILFHAVYRKKGNCEKQLKEFRYTMK